MIEPAIMYDIAWIVGVMLIAVVVYHLLALIIMGVLVFHDSLPSTFLHSLPLTVILVVLVLPAFDGIVSTWKWFEKHFPNAAKRLSGFVNERIDDSVIENE